MLNKISGLIAEKILNKPAYCAVTLERMAEAFPGIEIKRVKG